MIPEAMYEVLKDEGVVAIVTQGKDSPHVVNTWNSYLTVTPEGFFLIPVAGMQVTEANLSQNPAVLMTMGSRNVQGLRYLGTGFLVKGTAAMQKSGHEFDVMQERFDWMRAVLVVKPETITQTL